MLAVIIWHTFCVIYNTIVHALPGFLLSPAITKETPGLVTGGSLNFKASSRNITRGCLRTSSEGRAIILGSKL